MSGKVGMGRNTFDAGHYCAKEQKEILFVVVIGDPAVCPSCGEYLDGVPSEEKIQKRVADNISEASVPRAFERRRV